MYYLRTQPKAQAIQFTVDQAQLAATTSTSTKAPVTQKDADKVRNDSMAEKENAKNGTAMDDEMPSTKSLQTQDDEEVCLSCGA
mmetsp:Transcript_7022/g.13687  ORF Transcript_7022/g.13687 Transcript_7022/m.13687 type:complete len:84 (+) Transcript_7022:2-253(+)